MAQDGDILGGMPGTDAGGILMKGDIEHPMHLVLNAPMTAHRCAKRLGAQDPTEQIVADFVGRAGQRMSGVERASFEVNEDGLVHSVKIGDAIDFDVKDIVPFGVETGEPAKLVGVFHPASSELTAAEATHSRINAFGIEYEGKTGLSAPFSWAA